MRKLNGKEILKGEWPGKEGGKVRSRRKEEEEEFVAQFETVKWAAPMYVLPQRRLC